MNPSQFSTYIKLQLEQGMTRDAIRNHLISAGWSDRAVDDAFRLFESQWSTVPKGDRRRGDGGEMQIFVPRTKRHYMRKSLLALVVLLILFAAFSFLFNRGLLGSMGRLGVNDDEKIAIASAILARRRVLESGNADNIRGYLSIGASAVEAERYGSMDDAQILSLAEKLLAGSGHLTSESLLSSRTSWRRISESEIEVTLSTGEGPVKRMSRRVDGTWY